MAVEARTVGSSSADFTRDKLTLNGAAEPGDVLQAWDGRACVVAGVDDLASGDIATVFVSGEFEVTLTNSITVIKGTPLWWDESANTATVIPAAAAGDFYLGLATEDVTGGTAVRCKFRLNEKPVYICGTHTGPGMQSDDWTVQEVGAAGAPRVKTMPGGGIRLTLDATSEAQAVSAMTDTGVPPTDKWIFEALVNVVDDGDAGSSSTMDVTIGVANDDHATDADSITESCFFQLSGNTLDINCESDDGTTEVAATDSTVNYALGTPFLLQIDGRQDADLQMYINGVLVLGSSVFTMAAATGPLRALAQVEKSADATTADYRILYMGIRRVDTGGAS